MASKKWYVRQKNSSKHVEGDWIYYVSDRKWTGALSNAKAWRTKKEAIAFSSENGGEVYGE